MNAKIDLSCVQLETERLILRPFKESDAEDFYAYARVEGVGEMAGWRHHQSLEESRAVLRLFEEGKITLALVFKETGKVIGSIGLETYDEQAAGEAFAPLACREIGFVLSKAFWGQGLMPEAVREILRFCFEDLHLDAVFCGHFTRNVQSARVQEKCGFRELTTTAYHTRMGTVEESVLSVLTKADWAKAD